METFKFEWNFSPPDFFEEEHTYSAFGCSVVIRNGLATAFTTAKDANNDAKLEANLHKDLEAKFRAAQIRYPASFRLDQHAAKSAIRADGSVAIMQLVDSVHVRFHERLEVTQTDASGNVICHSIIAGKRGEVGQLSQLAAKHVNDNTLSAMLASYQKSIDDPTSLFIRLYDVRDAAATRFGGEQQARSALALNRNDWSTLGKLANDEPIREGRHIGKKAGQLRDATPTEISEGRRIAGDIIHAYLRWIDSQVVQQ